MNQLSRPLLARIAAGAIALTVLWALVAAWASMAGLVLGGIATLALAFTFIDLFLRERAPASTTPEPAYAADLGNASTIFASIGEPVFAYDGLFKIVFANDAALELLQLNRDELKNFVITPQLAQKDPRFVRLVQIVYPSLAPSVVPRTSAVADLTFSDPEAHLRVTTVALPDHKGFLKVINDRTRQVEILRGKGEFVTVASHQLRTPLTEVSWALETLASSTTIAPDDKALVSQTLDSIRGLVRTAEDLLGVAKIEEGRFGYRFEMIDIVTVLDENLGKALPIVEAAGLKLYFDRPTTPLPVYIDREKIAMVINNLVENAMRYNTQNGEITVKAEALTDEPFVRISVRDTGIGIDQGDVNRLFTKFFRAENARKAVAGGTGLGLYIISNIVRAHGGQVGVTSEVGRGSTFYFTLATDERRVPQREIPEDIG